MGILFRAAWVVFSFSMASILFPWKGSAETLQEALAAAYSNNPDLLAARATLRSVDEMVPQALSNWRPTLDYSASAGKSAMMTKPRQDSYNLDPWSQELALSQPLYRGGQTVADTQRAKSLVRAERYSLLTAEQQILLDAATAYIEVLRDEAVLKLKRNNETFLQKQQSITSQQFELGQKTKTDVSQAKARLSRSIAGRIRARADLRSSKATYLKVIGMDSGDMTEPTPLTWMPPTLEEALKIALKENPEILAARYDEEAARHNVRKIIGELLPTVSLSGELSRTRQTSNPDARTDSAEIGVELTLPLYQSGSVSSRVREARQTVSQKREKINSALRNVKEETTSAWEDLVAARVQITSFQDEIEASKVALEGVRIEASVGFRTILDILDAEQEFLDANVSFVTAKSDEFIAGLKLLKAIGWLTANRMELAGKLYDPEVHYQNVRDKWWGLGLTPEE